MNQANRPRADGAPAPPASGPVEREVRRQHSLLVRRDKGTVDHADRARRQNNTAPKSVMDIAVPPRPAEEIAGIGCGAETTEEGGGTPDASK